MENKLVSFIIPSYNSGKTIALCLNAVYNQDYRNMEVIVVDDWSTDESPGILEKYPCKVHKTPAPRSGPSTARNIGAEKSRGSILFFVDSDVALSANALSNVIREFGKDPQIGSVCGIYSKTPLIYDSPVEEYRTLQGHYWRKSSEGFVTPMFFSLGAIRKEVFHEIGNLNTELKDAEDVEYGHRLTQKYKLLLTSQVVGRHDDEDKLLTALKKFYKRSRCRVPIYIKRGKPVKGFETPGRALGMFFAAMALFLMPLSIFQPAGAVISGLAFIFFLLTDIKQYCFVYREKGLLFTIYFTLIHFIISVDVFLGVVSGVFEWVLNKKFREKSKTL